MGIHVAVGGAGSLVLPRTGVDGKRGARSDLEGGPLVVNLNFWQSVLTDAGKLFDGLGFWCCWVLFMCSRGRHKDVCKLSRVVKLLSVSLGRTKRKARAIQLSLNQGGADPILTSLPGETSNFSRR